MMNTTAKLSRWSDSTKPPRMHFFPSDDSSPVSKPHQAETPHWSVKDDMALLEVIDEPQLLFTPIDSPSIKLVDKVALLGLDSTLPASNVRVAAPCQSENALPRKGAMKKRPHHKEPFQSPRAVNNNNKKKFALGDSTNTKSF